MRNKGTNVAISDKTMQAISYLMDTEKREQIHMRYAPCKRMEFLQHYCEIDPEFEKVLRDEFSLEI